MGSILPAAQEFLTGKGGYLVAVMSIVATMIGPQTISAFNQPGMNLGFSNFVDAGAPPEGITPGLYLDEVIQWYDASTFRDANGNKLPGRNQVGVLANTNQLLYLSKLKEPLTGAHIGVDVIVPLVAGSVSTPGNSESNAGGLGDIIFAPVFQWNNHYLFGLPYFHRFVVHTTAPTGDFDQRFAFNPGSNVWSVAPYYSQTLWFLPYLDLEISMRHYWRYVTENPDTGIQPGQLYYVNYAASYGLTQNFRGGLNGYALQQLTDDRQSGNRIANSKERVIGLGPGILYTKGTLTLLVNYYQEFAVENRPEGFRLAGQLLYKF